mmetsp:Transcript_16804/g.39532  ORF Transcript_16804/g.39532 Transcript_16804/m.39532 type:complete len:97 (-) Transcript_16804:135-425(-)
MIPSASMSTTGWVAIAKPFCGQVPILRLTRDMAAARGRITEIEMGLEKVVENEAAGSSLPGRWTRGEKGKGKGAAGQKRSFYSQEDDRMEDMVRGA